MQFKWRAPLHVIWLASQMLEAILLSAFQTHLALQTLPAFYFWCQSFRHDKNCCQHPKKRWRVDLPAFALAFRGLKDWTLKLDVLGCSKGFGQRLPWNIGLLLRKLWVVVCFHSRHLTICKHSCVRHISWAFRSAISGKQTMFTNCKASGMEADNNSQLTQ